MSIHLSRYSQQWVTSGSLFHFLSIAELWAFSEIFFITRKVPGHFSSNSVNDCCRQGNESITFWERYGGYRDRDPDQSANPDSNPRSVLVEDTRVCYLWVLSSFNVYCNKYTNNYIGVGVEAAAISCVRRSVNALRSTAYVSTWDAWTGSAGYHRTSWTVRASIL